MTDEQKRLAENMFNQNHTYSEISRAVGTSRDAVKAYIRRRRCTPALEKPDKSADSCKNCGLVIVQKAKQKPRKFCSTECRYAWFNRNRVSSRKNSLVRAVCPYCGAVFEKYASAPKKYCSHKCYVLFRKGRR